MIRLSTYAAALALAVLAVGPAQAVEAEKVFKFYCAQCHGLGGKGDGPNVTEDLRSPRATSPMPRRWRSFPMRTSRT